MQVFSYEEMEQKSLPVDILEDMRRFRYLRCDAFEGYTCLSIEMLDYQNLLLSKGSVLFYLEKEKTYCFTSRKEAVSGLFSEIEEKYGKEKELYGFLEEITKEEDLVFDEMEKEIMALEEALLLSGKRECVADIIDLRKRLMVLKNYDEQLLRVLDQLLQNENKIFEEKTLHSFKMLYRHTERQFQNVMNLRESVAQVRESYEAEVDISLNMTMKLFTVVTTIFLPLTLIAGWYGMNFKMPEYDWKYGYLFVSAISIIFVFLGILYFRKRKWF